MRSYLHRARSGPHSIHDARQHAWALLVLGPGAPAPRQRPHRGLLSDLPDVYVPARPSLLARLIARLTGSESEPDEAAGQDGEEGSHWWRASARRKAKPDTDNDRLAA